MKKYVSPEIEVTKVETADIMASADATKDVDINVSGLMGYNPFEA